MKVPGRLRGKVEHDDLAQEVLAKAHRKACRFPEGNKQELRAYLRKTVGWVMADMSQHFGRGKRQAFRERAQAVTPDGSSSRLQGWLVSDHTTPSGA